MKSVFISVFLSALFLFVTSCRYEAPLMHEHTIPVDASVLGCWQPVADGSHSPDSNEHMLVLQYSETEYLIHYSAKEEPMYFRGYPISIGGVACVQLQLIGIDNAPVDRRANERFHVVSYALDNGDLVIRTLNADVVDDSLKDTESLVKAFLKHTGDAKLFTDPCRFRKVKTG